MPERNDDSKTRTKWAEDRTILANERTFSSWMGMGLGAVGVAIGLKAVFGATEPTWVAKLAATSFLVIAVVVFWMAHNQACKTLERLRDNDAEAMPVRNYRLLSTAMTVATLAVGGVLWSLCGRFTPPPAPHSLRPQANPLPEPSCQTLPCTKSLPANTGQRPLLTLWVRTRWCAR